MFRFTIRDVLWLTVVAALAVGWWLAHSRAANRHEAVIAHAERIRTVLIDAQRAYEVSANQFFQRSHGGFLPQEPDWGAAVTALDALAGMANAKEGGGN